MLVESDNPDFLFHEEYRDTWMFAIGGVYRVNPTWTLRAGVGFDESPVVDAFRDTGVPDKDRYMVGIGVGYNEFVTRLDIEKDSFNGRLRVGYGGPLAYVTVGF